MQDLLDSITNQVIDRVKLPSRFAELYPAVKAYVATWGFGRMVDLESEAIRSRLSRVEIQDGIAKYLARKIAELTLDRHTTEFERADFKLSERKPFSRRRRASLRRPHAASPVWMFQPRGELFRELPEQ